ncbi:MAG: hypothetical protein H6625_06130 [Bdellovibrionaceae bacterium]|nr:hypothetical protein [Pseudobdellovibrionaceae bacterium]
MIRLILVTLFYFSFSFVWAMEDHCVTDCSDSCQQQAVNAEKAIVSQLRVCRGDAPTLTVPECAQACSKGCKAVMRGQLQLVVEFYEYCGGGNGSLGRLQCVNTQDGYVIMNTHSLKYIGDPFSRSGDCDEAANTLNYSVFCAKYSGGYAVFNLLGQRLGEDSTFMNQCVETIMTEKNDKMCAKVSLNNYGIYDLRTMQRVGKDYTFLSSCKQDL